MSAQTDPLWWLIAATLALAFGAALTATAVTDHARARRWEHHLAAVGLSNDDMRRRYENRSDQ